MPLLLPEPVQALFPSEAEEVGYEFFRGRHKPDFAAPDGAMVNAWWCSQLALLVYLEEKHPIAGALARAGLQLQGGVIDNDVVQAFVAYGGDQTAYVCVRGTVIPVPEWPLDAAAERASYREWKANLQAGLVPARAPLQGRVHHGFQNLLQPLAPEVQTRLAALAEAQRVVYTGHSLGGALATLLSGVVNPPPRCTQQLIVSFGSPRIGDQALADGLSAPHWRFVHGADLVPDLPPGHVLGAATGYVHHGQPRLLSHLGSSQENAIALVEGVLGKLSGAERAESHVELDIVPAGIIDHAPLLYALECEKRI